MSRPLLALLVVAGVAAAFGAAGALVAAGYYQ